jgi:actin-related protein
MSPDRRRHHVFYNELKMAPEEHAVLQTYASDIPQSTKAKLIQIMYETFNVSSLYLGDQVLEWPTHYF